MIVKTLTFYSYKGGTGRSLLLANAARYLALLGKRVVALDFDFEAPGLHYKLNISPTGKRMADVVPARGAVDYLLAAAVEDGPPKRLHDYVVSVPLPRGVDGSLKLIPAGSAPTGEYWKALTALMRQDLFMDPEGRGIAACLELKARIEDELRADFLLLDSRTGVTELAGVPTAVLADKVVCLMLANRESQTGARAVLRSLRQAARLAGQAPIEVVPVLSRIPEVDESTVRETLAFLNEPGPSAEATLVIERIYVLRSDAELGRAERLHVGSGESESRSPLHQDYLALLAKLVEADPAKAFAAARRLEAIRDTRKWLTEEYDYHRLRLPRPFRDAQIDEGVRVEGAGPGSRDFRYADLVLYSGEDRTEGLMAVEYVEDLASSDAWKWWQERTKLRCVMLIGEHEENRPQRRVFTRGRRRRALIERDEWNGWGVRWPVSFSGLDDPGDRSAPSLLAGVQQGEAEFIHHLVREWQRASFVTLHGGTPFRPELARAIIDGLAQVSDVETEVHVLWRTAPDPFVRSDEGMRPHRGISLEEMTTRELHAPLWWRLSVEAKVEYWRGHTACHAGIEMLARDLIGLSFDQDRDFRREVGRLLGSVDETDDSNRGAYRFADLFQERELKLELSDEYPPELARRAAIRQRLEEPRRDRDDRDPWSAASREAERALADDRTLSALLRVPDGHVSVPTTNLLALYEPDSARVKLYRKVVDGCARLLGIDGRALANVAFLHETVHALCHLGRDLDGRRWEEFALPPSRDPSFRPSALHEALAQFFAHRLLTRLADPALLAAFERLSEHQPPEYQAWKKMLDVPAERVRAVLLRARSGADDMPWG